MKKAHIIFGFFFLLIFAAIVFVSKASGQDAKETFTGTVVSFGTGNNTRSVTRTFTLHLNGQTSDADVARYLSALQEKGQNGLLDEINDQNLGNFSVGGRVGRTVNVVRSSEIDGQRRIYIVFERWLQFAELRGGYRSVDYPFGFIELNIDPRTGKGSGTYIEAAQIRWKRGEESNDYHIEIENFATFPSRLLGVTQTKGRVR